MVAKWQRFSKDKVNVHISCYGGYLRAIYIKQVFKVNEFIFDSFTLNTVANIYR